MNPQYGLRSRINRRYWLETVAVSAAAAMGLPRLRAADGPAAALADGGGLPRRHG